ncbi:hypothetical protein [Paenibacillus odorifer]|uniref:Uncharacterized protein n=1 Tax=Paenibacillus odorifer TaxID=189426 RepID=A0AAD0P2S9_9BACL|nr:hypothetical protein [Paenibacillus odorifer]AWV32370.1 hypothetical protein CD191_06935 [Paenibacillus odorifer]
MAGYLCKCGNHLSTTETPNDIELRVYTDREWDMLIQQDLIDPITIPLPEYDVWLCPKCQRLYFFNWDTGEPVKIYNLE